MTNHILIPCDLCGEKETRLLYRTKEYNILRCPACTLRFVDTRPFEKDLKAFYDANIYEEYAFPVENLAERLADDLVARTFRFLPAMKTGVRLLDLGCGQGTYLHHLGKDPRALSWRLVGSDVSKENIAVGQKNYAEIELHCGDVRRMNWPAESFDVITLWDVIEHLTEARSITAEAVRLLKPGGFLLLKTPNARGVLFVIAGLLYRLSGGLIRGPVARLYNRSHVKAFDKKTITRLMNSLGLSLAGYEENESYVTAIAFGALPSAQKILFGAMKGLGRLSLFGGQHEFTAAFQKAQK